MIEFIKKILKKYIGESAYKKNVMTMISGRIVSQVIPILLTPILTRIYSPQEFGIFGVYSTIITILAMLASGRYCLAIVLPKEEEEAKDLAVISSILTIVSTLIFLILAVFFGESLFTLLNSEVLQKYIWVVILGIWVIAMHEILFYYGLRLKKYKILAIDVTIYASLVLIIRLVLGYMGYTEMGLFLSYSLGYLFSFFFLFISLSIYKEFKGIEINIKKYKLLLLKYLKFPKFSLIAETLNIGALMFPNLFLNKIFGSATAGYFAMSDKVLGTPIWFITMSVGDVFKQEAAEQFREQGSCENIFNKTTKALFLLGIIPFSLLFIIGPYIFPIIFGPNWEPIGFYIRIFSIMYFARFVVYPVTNVVYILNKQNYNVVFQLLKIIALVIAFVLGYVYKDVTVALIVWSGLTVFVYLFIFIFLKKLTKNIRNL
jgi:O-antigen/teichoic acid export membrane protein